MKTLIFILSLVYILSANQLAGSLSPYLQQHVNNPVNWHPFSEASLQKAKKEHKMILLSIGYSTCHWCHNMARESFEDEKVAEIMNRYFIPIKIDKEEMPHLDDYYQKVHRIGTEKRGGWPLTVFLTEDMEVFFSATYIPKTDNYGVRGLIPLMQEFGQTYTIRKNPFIKEITDYKNKVSAYEKENFKPLETSKEALIKQIISQLKARYDEDFGGFLGEGVQPKFPESWSLELLMNVYQITKDKALLEMASFTLKQMAKGGIYDQFEGAFFRYSTDSDWTFPHYEKMLYTNAQIIQTYLKAYRLTKNPLFKHIALESAEWILEYFYQKGYFFSASNADSLGKEGGYFIHKKAPLYQALKQNGFSHEESENVLDYYAITERGNAEEGFSNPSIFDEEAPQRIGEARKIFKQVRQSREFPFIDRKINTAWNAMMIQALFQLSILDQTYLKMAEDSLKKLLKSVYQNEKLHHAFLYGHETLAPGLLEDYAYLTQTLITGYQITLNSAYLKLADTLMEKAKTLFLREGRWYLDSNQKYLSTFEDREYKNAPALISDSLLTLSILNEDSQGYYEAKKMIESTSSFYLENIWRNASITHTLLKLKEGAIIIKAQKSKLSGKLPLIRHLDFPFLYIKTIPGKEWLACRDLACYLTEKDPDRFLKSILE